MASALTEEWVHGIKTEIRDNRLLVGNIIETVEPESFDLSEEWHTMPLPLVDINAKELNEHLDAYEGARIVLMNHEGGSYGYPMKIHSLYDYPAGISYGLVIEGFQYDHCVRYYTAYEHNTGYVDRFRERYVDGHFEEYKPALILQHGKQWFERKENTDTESEYEHLQKAGVLAKGIGYHQFMSKIGGTE